MLMVVVATVSFFWFLCGQSVIIEDMRNAFVCVVALVLVFGCNRKVEQELSEKDVLKTVDSFGFVNAKSLAQVVDHAKELDKLVFLDVYTDWCLPCKMMDEDVFPDKFLGKFYSKHFVSYKVNAETEDGSDLAELYQVPGYPTLLFLDQRGRILVKKIGVAYQEEMYDLADSALAKAKAAAEPTDMEY